MKAISRILVSAFWAIVLITVAVPAAWHFRIRSMFNPWWPPFFGQFSIYLPTGTIVATLPHHYTTELVNGQTFYHGRHHWYRRCEDGFVIVDEPMPQTALIAEAPKADSTHAGHSENPDNLVVNIPCPDGSSTQVKLQKHHDGYVGPQGEFYPGRPGIAELKTLYGH